MTTGDRVREDLQYVTGAVRRAERDDGPANIYLMWAVLIAIGFALPDFRPQWSGPYWLIAGPGGAAASAWLGKRHSERCGIRDADFFRRWTYHWLLGGFMGWLLVFMPVATGRIDAPAGVANLLLVLGLTYVLAGVHLQRPLLWSGIIMWAGYAALSMFDLPYVWTTTGLIVAASMLLAALTARTRTAILQR